MEPLDCNLWPFAGLPLTTGERDLFRSLFPFAPVVRDNPVGLLAPALKHFFSDDLSVSVSKAYGEVFSPDDPANMVLGEMRLSGIEKVPLCNLTIHVETIGEIAEWAPRGRKWELATELLFPLLLPGHWTYRITIAAPPTNSLSEGFLDVNLLLD